MSRRQQASVSSVVQKHAAAKNPTIKLLGYALAGEGLARVVIDVSHNQHSREDHSLISESMSQLFENKLMPVSCSFMSVDKAPYTERIEGIVRVNTESVPLAAAKGFRSVSSNIFMDDEDKMWVLRKTEAGDLLVKNTGIEDHESLRHLLDVACSSGYSLSSEFKKSTTQLSDMQQQVGGGSYIQYVSSTSGEACFGFVVASVEDNKLLVLPQDAPADSEGEVVQREAVTKDFDTKDMPETAMSEQEQMDVAVSTSRGVVNVSTLLDYYKKVFARDAGYYAEFAKRVRAHSFM